MVYSARSAWDLAADEVSDRLVMTYEEAVVYADEAGESVLHEGPVRILPNGWVQLPTGRLLSPSSVHHVDRVPEPKD